MKPPRTRFSRREWSVVQAHRTPHSVQQYLNSLPYNAEDDGPTLRSFRGVVASGTAHCLEAAIAAAVILEQHGYPPLFLDLHSHDDLDHVLFLYRRDGLWGTVARSRDPGLHGRRPLFSSLRSLVDSYFDPFIDHSGRIIGYARADLSELDPYDWRLSPRNVWKVERFFQGLHHTRFAGSDRRYRRWFDRYARFRARHPGKKPIYYEGRGAWKSGYPKGH